MSTPATPLRTLPPDFFSAPGATGSQLRTLPPDFFEGNTQGQGTGSPTIDAFIDRVTKGSPLNPSNWGDMIQSAFSSPFSDEHMEKAQRLIDASEKTGSILPIITGDENPSSKTAGDYAGQLTNAGVLALATMGLAKGVGAAKAKLTTPDIPTEVVHAWSPPSNDSEFSPKATAGVSDVKTYGGGPSAKPGLVKNPNQWGNYDFVPDSLNPKSGTDTAINVLQGGMDKWVDRAEKSGIRISGDNIVQSVKDSIPPRLIQEDPEYAQGLVDRAKAAYGGQIFSPTQFRDFLRTGNASDSPFYSKLQTTQATNSAAGSPQAIDAAITNGIRGQLYPALDPENNGAGPREIQDRTGNLIALRKQAESQINPTFQQKPGTVGDVAPNIVRGVINAATGGLADKVAGMQSSLLHPFIGPTDATIARIMKYAPDADPIPLPDGEYPAEQGPQNRYYDPRPNRLGAAPMEMMPQQRQLGAPSSVPTGTRPGNYAPGTPQTIVRDSSGNVIPVEGGLYNDLTRRNLEPEVDTTGYGTRLIEAPPNGTITKFPNPPANSGEFIDSKTGEILDTTPASNQPRQFNAPAQGRSGLRVGTQSGGSRVASPTGQEVSPTQHFESPSVNPDMVAQLKYGKKYQSLSPAERDYVDGVVSGKAEIKLSDILRK